MSNILTAKIKIKGNRPLFWHHFGRDAIPLEKQERTGVAGNDPEEWKRTVLHTKDGQLYVKGNYAFSCLVGGARFTKKGRGSIQSLVAATLQIQEERILIDRYIPGFDSSNGGLPNELPEDSDLPVYLDVRSVRNPGTKGRNIRYRVVASPGWTANFTIEWDSTIVSRSEMEAVAIDAGKLVGIGNGRAIGMGRFVVEGFEIEG